MLQRTDGPSTDGLEGVVAQGDPDRLDLVALAEAAAGPLHGKRLPSASESCWTSSLSMMCRSVLLAASCETARLRSKAGSASAPVTMSAPVSGSASASTSATALASPTGSSDIERIVVAGGSGPGGRLGAGRRRPGPASGWGDAASTAAAARRSRRGCPGSSASGTPRRAGRRRRSRARGLPSPRARRYGPASGGSCRTWSPSTSGLAVRFTYHAGCWSAPPRDATRTTRLSSCRGEVSMLDRASPVRRPTVPSSTAGMPRSVAGQRPPVIRSAPLWRPLRVFHPIRLESLRWGGDGGGGGVSGLGFGVGFGFGMVGCRVCALRMGRHGTGCIGS